MKKAVLLFLFIINLIWSQENKISGVIKDSETLEPIPFVNVYFESDSNNNSTGTISNENGAFSIKRRRK